MRMISKSILFAWLCVLSAFFASCNTSEADLLKYSSEDDAVIITGSLSDILENAGCTVKGTDIKLSRQLRSRGNTQLQNVDLGVDIDHCILTYNMATQTVVIGAPLRSASKLERVISAEESVARTKTERAGMTIYRYNSDAHIVLCDDICFMVFSSYRNSEAPEVVIRSCRDRALNRPLASWQKAALEADHTCTAMLNIGKIHGDRDFSSLLAPGYDASLLGKGWVRITADLSGSSLKMASQVYSAQGEALSNSLLSSKADTGMLKYASPGAVAVAMINIDGNADWSAILSSSLRNPTMRMLGIYVDEPTVAAIAAVMSNLSGTVMVSVEPGSLLELASPQGWGVTVAAQMRQGAAQEFVANFRSVIESQGVPCQETPNGFTAEIPQTATITSRADGDVFIASTLHGSATDEKGKYIAADDFGNAFGGLAVRMPAGYPLLSLLNLNSGLEFTYMAYPDKVTLELSLPMSKEPLLQTLLDLLPEDHGDPLR